MVSWIKGVMADFVALDERPTSLEAGQDYPYVGIRGYGGGLFNGGVVRLGETAYRALNRLSAGMLVLSQVKGWEGAVAICPPDFEGFLASPEYRTFSCRSGRALPDFVGWVARAPWFHTRLARLSRGQGARRERVRPELFLEMPICLPPVEDQRRLVQSIDRVAVLVEQQKEMHRAMLIELGAMLANSFAHIITDAPRLTMSEVAPLHRRPVQIEPEGEYPELAVRSFGRGVFHKGILVGAELTWQSLFRVEKGDLLFSNIKAWEGAFAVVGQDDHGRVGSHRYLTCVPVPDVAESWFLWFYLQTPEGLLQIQEASPGSADRNRTLSTKRLMAIKVPVPSIEKQHAFARLLGRANKARQAIASASSDRDQLLPVLLRQIFADAAHAFPGTERSAA